MFQGGEPWAIGLSKAAVRGSIPREAAFETTKPLTKRRCKMARSTLRGHEIEWDEKQDAYVYSDTHEPTVETYKDRPCGNCGLTETPEGYDGCLGTLPGVINACCGHGVTQDAFVQFEDGRRLSGNEAINAMGKLKRENHETTKPLTRKKPMTEKQTERRVKMPEGMEWKRNAVNASKEQWDLIGETGVIASVLYGPFMHPKYNWVWGTKTGAETEGCLTLPVAQQTAEESLVGSYGIEWEEVEPEYVLRVITYQNYYTSQFFVLRYADKVIFEKKIVEIQNSKSIKLHTYGLTDNGKMVELPLPEAEG